MRKSIHQTARAFIYTLLPLVAMATPGCGKPGFDNSYHSMEQLAQAVLDALELKDEEALWALIITPEEHETLLWEHLPESRTYSFDYVRQWSERNSRKGLRNALARFGGIDYDLIDIEFTEEPEEYPDFTVYFGTRLHVRRTDTGASGVLPVLDVVVERNGQWKLMNFEE
ncbi:MAG: hypothetical protein JSW71_19565 [Gemmatimonadota bacterium]|nr:MAG: hypothetical protein JSW71_19565 [Gemmatimonadota bacterium]